MQRSDVTEQIRCDTEHLSRTRLVCALLRQEGILSDNSRFVIDLADRLLKSLAYYAVR
jgi:hypothetical protein